MDDIVRSQSDHSEDGHRWSAAVPAAPVAVHEPPPVDLTHINHALRRWWPVVVASVALAGLVSWNYVRHIPDEYTAAAVIQLVDSRDALTGGLVRDQSGSSQGEAATLSQVEIIRSRGVAGAVVDSAPVGIRVKAVGFSVSDLDSVSLSSRTGGARLELFFNPTGFSIGADAARPTPYGQTAGSGGVRFSVIRHPSGADEGVLIVQSRDRAIDELLTDLDVAPRKQTNIIDIRYTHPDPSIAKRVVNLVAEMYQAINTRLAQQQLFRRRVFIQEQLIRTDQQRAEADRALSAFRSQQRAYSSQEKFKSQQTALVGLDVRREELSSDRQIVRDLLRKVQTGDAAARTTALSMLASASQTSGDRSPVPELYRKLVEYQRTRSELTSGPAGKAETHPEVQRLDSLIAATQRDMISSAQAHLALLDSRIAALDQLRSRDAGMLGQLPAAEASETRLQQNADALRAQAAALRTEYQQAQIAEAAEVGHVEIIDLASTAVLAKSNRGAVVLFALFLGLLGGVAVALLLERADHTVKRREQLEHALHVPVLGTIPRIDAEDRSRGSIISRLPKRVPASSRRSAVTTVIAAPGSAGAEAFRQLSTSFLYSRAGSAPRRILITSPTEGDGKTSIAANLCIALARQRHRVLLIDCDVYGKVHSLFQLPSSPGVSDVILNGLEPRDVLRASGVPGLTVMTSGKPADRAGDIVGSERMRAILDEMATDFDMVVLDCSPVLALADSTILGVSSDAVLLVVRAGHTAAAAAVEATRHLTTVGVHVAGIVLNDPDGRTRQYGEYYYGYTYSYGR